MLERWLDSAFFAGLEIGVLSIPALVALLTATPEGPIALAALTAITASTCAAATFRGGWIDLGDWPRPGDPYTIPVRSAYYSATVAGASYAGATVNLDGSSPGVGIAVASVVSVAAMAVLPWVVGGVRSAAERLSVAGR